MNKDCGVWAHIAYDKRGSTGHNASKLIFTQYLYVSSAGIFVFFSVCHNSICVEVLQYSAVLRQVDIT